MSNNYQDWDDDDDFEDTPKQPSDSDLIRQLRKQLKTKEAELKKFESELGELRGAQRNNLIQSVLSEKGVSPKVAKFIPNDLDATPEAIEAWVNENADVFGFQVNRQEQPSQQDLAALRQMDSITAGALTPDKEQDMFLRLDSAQSADEIINMIYGAEQ